MLPQNTFEALVVFGGGFLSQNENHPACARASSRSLPTLFRITRMSEGVTSFPCVPRKWSRTCSVPDLPPGPLVAGLLSAPDWCSKSAVVDKKMLEQSCKTIVEFLKLYGFQPRPTDDYTDLLKHWKKCSYQCGGSTAFMKYKLSAFFASFLKDVVSDRPFKRKDNPKHLLTGRAGRFISLQFRKGSKHATSFAYGILQIKKGLDRPSNRELKRAAWSSFKDLTSKKQDKFVKVGNYTFSISDVRRTIGEVVRETFSETRFSLSEYKSHLFAPSMNANYTNNRLLMGTYGLFSHGSGHSPESRHSWLVPGPALAPTFFDETGMCCELKCRDVVPYNSSREGEFDYSRFFGSNIRFHGEIHDSEVNRDIQSYSIDPKLISTAEKWYEHVLGTAMEEAVGEDTTTTLVALAEPLKVRVISKGPPWHYFLVKPLQDMFHSAMRAHPAFNLTGEVVTADLLNQRFNDFSGEFLSVDYKDATNLLNPELSLFTGRLMCKVARVPDPLSSFFATALCGHRVEDPNPSSGGSSLPQEWGQLMGSPASFVVLCIINAALIKLSFEADRTYHRSKLVRLRDLPVLINGDDAVLRCSREVYERWLKLTPICGFTPSIGKVYFSRTYLNINSASFVLIEGFDFSINRLEHCPYVNFGLMNGMTRSSSGGIRKLTFLEEREKRGQTLGSCHTDLLNCIESLPLPFRRGVHAMFVRKNYKILSSVRVPWYLPQSMGGLGLCPLKNEDGSYHEYRGVRFGPSDRDLLRARLLSNPGAFKYSIPNFCKGYSARNAWTPFFGQGLSSRVQLIGPEGPVDNTRLQEIFGKLDVLAYYSLYLSNKGENSNVLRFFERLHRRLDKFIKHGKLPFWEGWKCLLPVQTVYDVHISLANSETISCCA